MSNIQVLCDYDGISVLVYFTEDNCLDMEYNDSKYSFANHLERHTTLTADATQKLCELYQCDMAHLLEKVKEQFATDEEMLTLEFYGEVSIEEKFQRFCKENQLAYKIFIWPSNEADEDADHSLLWVDNERFKEFVDAVAGKNKAKVQKMLKDGFDVNAANKNGRTALMMAVQVGDLSMAKILIKAGANLEQPAKENETAFLYACRTSDNVKIIEYLIKQGANTQAKNVFGNNALFLAAEYNKCWKVAAYLIKTKLYDVNDQNCHYNYTPLMAAARYNTVDVLNVLIDHGADICAKDAGGWLPVLHAAANYEDNPMNLIRLIGLDPKTFFYKVGKENLRAVAEDNQNLSIRLAINSILSIILFAAKTEIRTIM